jgi:monoamine oxidase
LGLRDGTQGLFTLFLGGHPALRLAQGSAQAQAERMTRALEFVYPGFGAERSGSAERVHWPSEPFALGSYSCYRTGQWTGLAGLEGRRVGGLHFAGEHCSRAFQGYMNGAAETGRRAAFEILQRCV